MQNYNNISKNTNQKEAHQKEAHQKEAHQKEAYVAATTVKQEAKEVVTKVGTISNCEKLNIRDQSNISSNVVAVACLNDSVIIDTSYINDEWYSVKYKNEKTVTDGFCMKDFVVVK